MVARHRELITNTSFKKRTLITGANGFIGSALIESLLQKNDYAIHAVTRTFNKLPIHSQIKAFQIKRINVETNGHEALHGCDMVVHTAVNVHVMQDKASDPLANVYGTLNLVKQAIEQKRIWMFPMPKTLLTLVANKITGQRATIDRLYNSLQVDTNEAQKIHNWSPIVSVDETLTNALSIR